MTAIILLNGGNCSDAANHRDQKTLLFVDAKHDTTKL